MEQSSFQKYTLGKTMDRGRVGRVEQSSDQRSHGCNFISKIKISLAWIWGDISYKINLLEEKFKGVLVEGRGNEHWILSSINKVQKKYQQNYGIERYRWEGDTRPKGDSGYGGLILQKKSKEVVVVDQSKEEILRNIPQLMLMKGKMSI